MTPPRAILLDDLAQLVGSDLGASGWLTVDQAMIDAFAKVTNDHQWIHVDVERATHEAGGTIAHGLLILSLIAGLTGQIASYPDRTHGLNYGFNKIRFTQPVPAGAEIRLCEKIIGVERKGEGYLVTREYRIELRGSDRPALIAEWLTLLFR